MTRTIDFPHLGIHLSSVGNHITVFGFDIAYYGMIIGAGILAGIFMAVYEAKRTGQKEEDYYDLSICAVIISIIGARAYYVIFSWDMYKDDLLSIFNLRQGGLAIYGGVIAAVLTVIVFAKVKKLSAAQIFDTAGLGLVLGQAIGRWGNFFNREAFGQYSDGLFAMRLPVDAVRADEITELMKQHAYTVNGVAYIQVHPTFLYESLWNVGVLTVLLLVTFSGKKRFHGEIFLLYLLLYSAGRAWIEGLRTDQLRFAHTAIAVSQLLACILVIISGVSLIVLSRRKKGSQGRKS